MTLYEMSEATQQLYEMLTNEEIDEGTVKDTLEAMDIEGKLEDYCKIIKQYKADALMYGMESASLKEKQKRAENACKRLENNVIFFLQSSEKEKEKAGLFTVSIRKSESIQISVPPESLPESFRRIKTTIEADKKALKDFIKSGNVIDGVSIQTNKNLTIK